MATYYVSPYGSDSAPGTQAAPFATIQRAANAASAGDTVIVGNGVYSNPAASGEGSKLVTFSRSGSAGAPIVFMAENQGGAVLDGLGNTTAEALEFGGSYIRVQGFEVRGFSDTGMSNYAGGRFIEILDNDIHDIGRYCATTGIGRDGIFLGASDVVIRGNKIHDIGRYAPGESGCANSLYYQTNDHGIYIAGANNVTIEGNSFFNNRHGWSIHVYPSAVSGLAIRGNQFSQPNPWEPGYIIFAAGVSNSSVAGNTFSQPNTVAIHFYVTSGFSGLTIADNSVSGGQLADAAPSGVTFGSSATPGVIQAPAPSPIKDTIPVTLQPSASATITQQFAPVTYQQSAPALLGPPIPAPQPVAQPLPMGAMLAIGVVALAMILAD